ncbi:MAG: hypothetical protein V3V30_03420, partial [Parvularculaceae bacterium]
MRQHLLLASILASLVAACSDAKSENNTQIAGTAATAQIGQQGSTGALPSGSLRLKKIDIVDSQGFGKPVVARSMMVPVDWKTDGGVFWQMNESGCGPTTPHTVFTAQAPDGLTGIGILPTINYQGTNIPMPQGNPCKNMLNQTPRGLFTEYIKTYRPDARQLDYRGRPQLQSFFRSMMPQPMQMPGMQEQLLIEAGQVIIGYQEKGVEMRETLILIGMVKNVAFEPDMMTGQSMMMSNGSVLPVFVARAPNGQLDFQSVEALMGTMQDNPQYLKLMADHYRKMNKPSRPSNPGGGSSGPSVADIQMAGWKKRNASSDKGQREQVEAVYGVETYNDPINGGTVQLDNSYNNTWQLNDGTYVLTN